MRFQIPSTHPACSISEKKKEKPVVSSTNSGKMSTIIQPNHHGAPKVKATGYTMQNM
jgi:hypothetical protein